MTNRVTAAGPLAAAAGLFAAGEVVWVVAFLGRSSDGPAFVMALVAIVIVPTLLGALGAVLIPAVSWRLRAAAVAAVAASGLAAAGVEAGVFVADDPNDPAFIHWVADVPLIALATAVLLIGVAMWDLLRSLPPVGRLLPSVVVAVVTPVLLALALITSMPLVLLLALAAPIALAVVAVVHGRQHRRRVQS